MKILITALIAIIGLNPALAEVCQYGRAFIDQCDNQCTCMTDGNYACTRRACLVPGAKAEEPKKCETEGDIRVNGRTRVFCRQGITLFEPVENSQKCAPGTSWKESCNTCTCNSQGTLYACTRRACLPQQHSQSDEPQPKPGCQYGNAYLDECGNVCTCAANGQFYGCTFKLCRSGQTSQTPMACSSASDLPVLAGAHRVVCHENIVKLQAQDEPCLPGSVSKNDCNNCHCGPQGQWACTLIGCPTLVATGSTSNNQILTCDDGLPQCPADCGQQLDEQRNCWKCPCGPQLEFGDVVVRIDDPCPEGLSHGQNQWATKSCSAQNCEPGSSWTLDDGCSNCTCLATREPACTRCYRQPTSDTLTCDGGYPQCPADCGRVYNADQDCYDCPCGLERQAGDAVVPINEPCPEGMDARQHGAFTKTCAPFDHLPQGDTRLCDGPLDRCPQDCGLVRLAPNEGCVYCQCGPALKEGEVLVPHGQPCPEGLLPTSSLLQGRVCKPPNKDDCKPGARFNSGYDTCVCLSSGKAACTKRPGPVSTMPTPTPPTSSSSTPFYFP